MSANWQHVAGKEFLVDDRSSAYDSNRLIALCEQVCPNDASLVNEVRFAIDHPVEYWTTIQPQQRLQRANNTPPADLPWLTFLNGLLRRGQLDLLDWRASTNEIMTAVEGLLRNRTIDPQQKGWTDEATWDRRTAEDFLKAVGQRLRQQKMVLVNFSLDSDMYLIAVIDEDNFPSIAKQVRSTGYGALETFVDDDTAG